MMSRSLHLSSLQVHLTHWGRFVHFCRTKRWQVFNVRSHHFSKYLLHLFRDSLLPSTIISHRTSVASVLRHWKYDSAADPHIKLLIRIFRLEWPVQHRIMPKWDLHLVLSSLLSPPFASEFNDRGRIYDDVIDLRWWMMKTVFLKVLASARRRSYLHACVASGRCVFGRGNTQHQKMVSFLPETGVLAKNQLPSQALEWITVPGIAPSWPRCTRENVLSSHTLEWRERLSLWSHKEHHEKSYQQMDHWDHQRGLYMSRQRPRGQGHGAWSQSIICIMGLQLSHGSTWHSASCVLKVAKSLPKFLSARYGQHCWWDVNIGSCSGRSTSSGSRTSSPTSIAYKICMQPLLRHPSWRLPSCL